VLGVQGPAGDFCTITSSNLEEIEVGAKVVYADVSADPDEVGIVKARIASAEAVSLK
jgi:hypothetical protein